jgi:hypothetical protein
MQKDKYKIDVIFRVIKIQGITEITALFPHEVETLEGCVCCYAHEGQHGMANYTYCVSKGRLATKKEYKDLKKELQFRGYNLNIIQKQNRKKYLASLKALREKAFPK